MMLKIVPETPEATAKLLRRIAAEMLLKNGEGCMQSLILQNAANLIEEMKLIISGVENGSV